MRLEILVCLVALTVVCLGTPALAAKPTAEEMALKARWVRERLGRTAAALPFSFVYDGRPSATLLGAWECRRAVKRLDANRSRITITCRDPQTGLELRCVAVDYRDFPTVEWTLYLKNTGAADTPIIEKIQALDVPLADGFDGPALLHHAMGSVATAEDYRPLETPLAPGTSKRLVSAGGRPSNGVWPYVNLEWAGGGRIIAIGWPGQWAADLAREGSGALRVRAGQEVTRFKLLPGEEVRAPLIALQFWQGGDWIRAQNVWRRWMMAHSMPRPGGKLPPPMMVASSSRQYEEMTKADEASQIMFIDRYLEEGLKLDYWWMDAGWYVNETGWPQVGTWEVDPKRFPRGFRPISEHAHAKGLGILVWFEPERVAGGTWLAQNHPEWILGGAAGGLLNLGNPEARAWLTDHIDRLLTEQGIDLYRQDFNMDPLDFWRKNDAPDRQGITEIRHVEGYLAYWDELRRRHPNMLIDSCASGGRRNDLETMRRAVPLWRSDYAFEPIGHQGMTYGISLWLPFHGTGTVADSGAPYYGSGPTPVDAYAFWSNAAPSLGSGIDFRVKELDYAALRRLFGAWRAMSPCYYGDFYPLAPYSLEKNAWVAWQLDLPERGQGVVQAFRRQESSEGSRRFSLRALDAGARYVVTDLQSGAKTEAPGRELMEQGLPVALPKAPGAAVLGYRKKG